MIFGELLGAEPLHDDHIIHWRRRACMIGEVTGKTEQRTSGFNINIKVEQETMQRLPDLTYE